MGGNKVPWQYIDDNQRVQIFIEELSISLMSKVKNEQHKNFDVRCGLGVIIVIDTLWYVANSFVWPILDLNSS